jgi:hypothetical protein
VVLHAIQHLKPRLFGHGGVANPRDTYGYRCGLRLAPTKNPSVLNVPSSMQHHTRPGSRSRGGHAAKRSDSNVKAGKAWVAKEGTGLLLRHPYFFDKQSMPRVLLIDDDNELLELLRDYLQSDGFGVSCASDGPSGIKAILGDEPDIVVLDV